MSREIHVLDSPHALAADVAARLVSALAAAQRAHGRATLALTAGSIMEQVWSALAVSDAAQDLDWSAVDVFWGDERFVPADSPDRNDAPAERLLFGRTPFSQGSNGRDHNPFGFSLWLAGGGVKGGTIHGATDEFGYRAVEQPCDIYDLWATVLHLLGINHKDLTYRFSGRDVRLTDVHGNVLRDVLA